MSVEKILKSMTKKTLVTKALRLGIENPSQFNKDNLVAHLLKNIPEETLIDNLTLGVKKKRKLSIGLIGTYASIIGVIIAVVFFLISKKKDETIDNKIINLEKKLIESSEKPHSMELKSFSEDNIQIQNSNVKTYEVILVIPSNMSGAEVYVDDKPAAIIKQTPTIIKIMVSAKDSDENHKICIKKNNRSCTRKLVINENNLRVPICQ